MIPKKPKEAKTKVNDPAGLYNYLPKQGKCIRVLLLEPGVRADPITCTLETVELNEHAEYEALSYVWGDESKRKPVRVNGTEITVTENLETALWYLRDPTAQKRLWVDAICINQTDDAEKAIQVGMMTEIYASTSQVLVWLGPEQGESDRAMLLLDHMMAAVKTQERGGWTLEFPQVWTNMLNKLHEKWPSVAPTVLSRPW